MVDRNTALKHLYCRHWPTFIELYRSKKNLSKPFLAWVHPNYNSAATRLVVVGKETNGWGDRVSLLGKSSEEVVQAMMDEYREFGLGYDYAGKQSFWAPVHELYSLLNPGGRDYGFVALNASKMDQDSSMPEEDVKSAILRTAILPEEIRILQPHLVVFFTGPRYESWLDGWFPGLARRGTKLKAILTAPSLTCPAFRTYHPRGLNYLSRRKGVFDWIVQQVV